MAKRKRKNKLSPGSILPQAKIVKPSVTPPHNQNMNSQHQAHSSSDLIHMTSNVLYGDSPVYSPHGVNPPPPNYAPPPPVPHIPPSPTPPVSPPPIPYPPPSVSPVPHSTPTSMHYPQNSIASSLERQIIDMNNKLSKLDLLDNILHRLASLEQQYTGFQHDLARMRTEVQVVTAKTDQNHEHCNYVSDKVTVLENRNKELAESNYELREEIHRLQTRSMKDNLLFSGLPETPSPDGHEDAQQTEIIISDFIKNKLQINEDIPLQVAHRLKRRRDGRPRSIVAKFERRKDRERVLRAVKTGILNGTNLSVNEQFPAAISQRRQELLPKLREERAKGNRAHINYDTLYINGVPWTPAPTPPQNPR